MLKVGVVGCGGMGVWHLKKYSELPNIKIVAAGVITNREAQLSVAVAGPASKFRQFLLTPVCR